MPAAEIQRIVLGVGAGADGRPRARLWHNPAMPQLERSPGARQRLGRTPVPKVAALCRVAGHVRRHPRDAVAVPAG